jgi:protocatechuate 3,4-dioxygenase beta subunit
MTHSRGHVSLTSFAGFALEEIRVEVPDFGTQHLRVASDLAPGENQSLKVQLAPVGQIVGRLLPPGKEAIRGVSVRASTQVEGYSGSGKGGWAEVVVDPSGDFKIRAIAAGSLSIGILFDPKTSSLPRSEAQGRVNLVAGSVGRIEIPLCPTVRVSGSFVEKGTSRPIAGLTVALNGRFGGDNYAITGTDGKYQGFIARENWQPYGWPIRLPLPYYRPSVMPDFRQRMPESGMDQLALPRIELPRGVDVPGSVVDETGLPMAGATVEATWTQARGWPQLAVTTSDSHGHFRLQGIDPKSELNFSAHRGDSSTSGKTTLRAEAALTEPVILKVSSRNTALLRGRVLDAFGHPIAGASVRVWRFSIEKRPRVFDLEPIVSDVGLFTVQTDADGRYQAPRRVNVPDRFFAEVSAPGKLSSRSPSVLIDSEVSEIPNVKLRR